jgi:hypothetical protein
MANDPTSVDLSALGKQAMDQAQDATGQYLAWMQKNMSGAPWGNTELSQKMMAFAQQNIAASFEFVQKLNQVRDFQDLLRIQSEFMRTQMESFGKQAMELAEASTKTMSREPISKSS